MCQYNKMFSHVYVEKDVAEHPRTKQILEKLNNTTVIEIDHYKDVFCRKSRVFLLKAMPRRSFWQRIQAAAYMKVHRCVRALEMRISTIAHA